MSTIAVVLLVLSLVAFLVAAVLGWRPDGRGRWGPFLALGAALFVLVALLERLGVG